MVDQGFKRLMLGTVDRAVPAPVQRGSSDAPATTWQQAILQLPKLNYRSLGNQKPRLDFFRVSRSAWQQ
jgi:hypothetical protein